MPHTPYMTLEEAAEHMRVAEDQLRAALRTGALRGVRIGKRWVLRQDCLDAFYDRLLEGRSWASTGGKAARIGTSPSVGTSTAAVARLSDLKPSR